MNTSSNQARIVFLDYLRIIAFTSVLFGHLVYSNLAGFVANQDNHVTPRFLVGSLMPIAYEGGVGVVLFFLISGYIITLVSQRESSMEYAIKRIFRIYPLYIVAVFISYLLQDPSLRLPFKIVLMQLTLLGDFFTLPYTLGGVEWTLRIEIYFYFLMGLLCLLSKKLPLIETKKFPYIYFLIVVLIALLPPFTSGKLGWGGGWQSTGAVTLYFPFLLVGSLFFLYERKRIPISLALSLCAFIYGIYFILAPRYQPRWVGDHHAILALLVFVTFWKFRDFFGVSKVIFFISGLTYSVYLLHMWMYPYLLHLFKSWMRFPVLSVLAAWIGLFVVCVVLMYLVEQPGIRLGKALIQHFGLKVDRSAQ